MTPWTVARQAPLSMGFSKQEYQSGLPFPSPGDLPDPGIQSVPPAWQVDSLLLSHLGSLSREAVPPTSALPAGKGETHITEPSPVRSAVLTASSPLILSITT